MKIPRLILVALLLSTATTTVNAGDDKPVPLKVVTKRDDDRVDVKVEKGSTVVSVKSPFGISQAVVARADEKWPAPVVLKLHLKGLESFRVTAGKVRLEGSASLQDGKPLVRLWLDGKEGNTLDAKSPYWMDIRLIDRDGKPASEIPLKDGCFEMTLPKALFEGNPQSITASWIDFYRG